MTAPILLDLSHTSHTRARTGIQRVTRSLYAALGNRALPITFDPHRHVWRELDAWESIILTDSDAAKKRGAKWPLTAKLRGRAHRLFGRRSPSLPANRGVLVPEVFSPAVGRALPALFATGRSPRVALFHDAIALKLPELTPPGTVARFPSYLIELLQFDGIAAVSEDSRDSLVDYWRWLGVSNAPRVRAIPLGVLPQRPTPIGETPPAHSPPTILSLGSIEGRKNHLALLEACEGLWMRGEKFILHLIGLAQPKTAAAALAKIQALQAKGRPLRYDGPVSDARVDGAYAAATFTVYPSLLEGFGLPVLESLAHGKPCVCSNGGALGESARGGGCFALERMDASALATAISRLLHDRAELSRLSEEIRYRRFKTWTDYAAEISSWMDDLRNECAKRGVT